MCKENKRKKKKKVKEKERKEKVSPRKTNCLCFIRSSCTIQALVYCKYSHWLLRFDLRRSFLLLFSLRVYSLLLFKKITPNCFLSSNGNKRGLILLPFDTTKIIKTYFVASISYSPISTSFIDSRKVLMSFFTQGEHVERSLNAPVALSLNE